MRYNFTLLLILLFAGVSAQKNEYDSFIFTADSLFKKGNYQNSAQAYSKAFKSNKWKGRIDHRYGAAIAWAKANVPDSALSNLEKIVNSGNYIDYNSLTLESSFSYLHEDKRWTVVLNKLKKIEQGQSKEFDTALAATLEMVFQEDQKYRTIIDSLIEKEGRNAANVQKKIAEMLKVDSANLTIVSALLDKHGWLGPEQVGKKGGLTIFLVIQHANLNTQLKYLPMLKNAVSSGKAEASYLAYLEDRVLLQQNKRQIYGTQIGTVKPTGQKYVLPLSDPMNVDKRRALMGLEPLAVYLSDFNMEWKPAEYEKQLSIIDAKGQFKH